MDNHLCETLRHSSLYGHNGCIIRLLDSNNASVHDKDDFEQTPLHHVSGCGHNDCIITLLDRGANINEKDYSGSTPCHYASMRGADINARCYPQGSTPLHYASRFAHNDCIITLLERGTDYNIKNNHGKTAVEMADWIGGGMVQKWIKNKH